MLEATAIDAIRECRRRIWSSGCCSAPPRTRTTKTRFAALARLARRAGYFDGDFAPGLGASACGLRKVELTGASFLSAFGFLASRLPRCLLPLPMIVHPMVVLPAAMY